MFNLYPLCRHKVRRGHNQNGIYLKQGAIFKDCKHIIFHIGTRWNPQHKASIILKYELYYEVASLDAWKSFRSVPVLDYK